MAKLIAACVALAGISLLLPSEPSYDPWAWFVWGREVAQLELDTTGGPSWKPLPVAFAALVSPLAAVDLGVPPALWMLVSRTGALLALAMAFRLALRLTLDGAPAPGAGASRGRLAAAVLAGAVAAAALATMPDWYQFAAQGSEAPLAVALMLWAIERHLDGRRDHALILGTLTCLMRPELFPFLALYGVVVWRSDPRHRLLLAGLMLVLPLAWLVPEWLGSGNPLDGGEQARSEPFWSLSLYDSPWRRATLRVHNHSGAMIELLALAAVAVAIVRRQAAVVVIGAAAVAEAALYVAMTEGGFSGNPRYVLPALVLLCVLAGVGSARVAELAARLARSAANRAGAAGRPAAVGAAAGAALAVAGLTLLSAPLVDERLGRLRFEVREVATRMDHHRDLVAAMEEAGGAERVASYGPVTASRALHTRLAWVLERPIDDIETARGQGVVFKSSDEKLAGDLHVWGNARHRRFLAREGSWVVYRREGVPPWVFIRGAAWGFTRRLQAIDIPLVVAESSRSG
jgi:hypothetical protein